MRVPTITDVLRARLLLAGYLTPTPLSQYPALNALTGARLFIKHENMQPTGAFKVRGGLTLLAGMTPEERACGVTGYSTGNHAQSLAYAASAFGATCTIVMPEGANRAKVAAVERLGAELVTGGGDFEEARAICEQLAAKRGMRLVSAANEPNIITGAGTLYLEIFSAQPELDAVVVPVGSGTGAAAACLVAQALAPQCEVIAVQSSASPAAHDSWRTGSLLERLNRTAVEGLATGSAFELTQQVMRAYLSDFLLVSDDEIAHAQHVMLRDARTCAEGAGAAALAAVLKWPGRFAERRVAVVCSGGNLSEKELRSVLAA